MDFKKIRIIEAGPTANDWTDEVNGELKTGKIVITPESLASLVVAGSIRPIHSRRTHNGNDLLDQYIGSFSNFVEEKRSSLRRSDLFGSSLKELSAGGRIYEGHD